MNQHLKCRKIFSGQQWRGQSKPHSAKGTPSAEIQRHEVLSRVKQITSPGWMLETSAQGWCTGMTQRDGMGREVGGGIGMGNACKSMADSCQCTAKTTTTL